VTASGRRSPRSRRRAFWVGQGLGGALIAFGVVGLLLNAGATEPASWAAFFFGALLAHDLLIVPLVALAGLATVRLVPAWARPTVQGALVVSAIVALFSIPVVGGFGRLADNPSLLPGDYLRDLAIVEAAIWVVAAGLLVYARPARRAG